MRYIRSVVFVMFAVSIGFGSLCGAQSPAKDDGANLDTKYDAAKDQTTVGFDQVEIIASASETLYLSVEGSYPGHTPKKHPDDMIVIISSLVKQGYKYPKAMKMTITADGKQLPAVLMLNADQRRSDDYYLETLGTRMKYDTFQKMAQVKKVEVVLHETAFTLDESVIKKLLTLEKALHS